jgi:hypothetical protein
LTGISIRVLITLTMLGGEARERCTSRPKDRHARVGERLPGRIPEETDHEPEQERVAGRTVQPGGVDGAHPFHGIDASVREERLGLVRRQGLEALEPRREQGAGARVGIVEQARLELPGQRRLAAAGGSGDEVRGAHGAVVVCVEARDEPVEREALEETLQGVLVDASQRGGQVERREGLPGAVERRGQDLAGGLFHGGQHTGAARASRAEIQAKRCRQLREAGAIEEVTRATGGLPGAPT